jgi:hypothetical protein
MPNHMKIKAFICARGTGTFISRGSSERCRVTVPPTLHTAAVTRDWQLAHANCGNVSPHHQMSQLQVSVPPFQTNLCTSPQHCSWHRLMPTSGKNSKICQAWSHAHSFQTHHSNSTKSSTDSVTSIHIPDSTVQHSITAHSRCWIKQCSINVWFCIVFNKLVHLVFSNPASRNNAQHYHPHPTPPPPVPTSRHSSL